MGEQPNRRFLHRHRRSAPREEARLQDRLTSRLLFSGVVNSCVAQSSWAQTSSAHSQKSGFFSAISTSISGNGVEKEKRLDMVVVDSSIYPVGLPVPVSDQKLLKFVDMSQLCRGPLDSPGHWLVTGARLNL
ncbi:hypothetical protein U1Q18_029736 [Sarracenia purpurea var. burkii]